MFDDLPDTPADTSEPFDLGSAMDEVAAEMPDLGGTQKAAEPNAPAAPAAEKPAEPAAAAPAPAPAAPDTPYPKSWKPEFQEKWATLDPALKAEILRREDDFHKGTAPLRQAADFVRRFQEASAPVAELYRSGVDPIALYRNFAEAHATLSKGGPEALTFLRSLAEDYRIDLNAEVPYVDPSLRALQQEVSGLHSQLSAREQADLAARRTQAQSQIEAFAADPKNAHFDAVATEMAAFLKADPKMTLEDAYAKAVWANPSVREKLLTAEIEAKKAKAAAEEADRAVKAAAASKGSVRNTARTAPATGAVGSMDDTMKETLARLRAKG